MSYQDDDGETTDILSEHDLTEAIQYFHAGPEDNMSSNGSILSGYSGRVSRKITLRLRVAVEYDGPSLSDTGSLVSMEDYEKRNSGSIHLSDTDSFNPSGFVPQELEDDAITISSHDTSRTGSHVHHNPGHFSQRDFANRFSESLSIEEEEVDAEISLSDSATNPSQAFDSSHQSYSNPFDTDPTSLPAPSSLEVPSGPRKQPSSPTVSSRTAEPASDQVFERLRQLESDPFAASQQSLPLDANDRGVRWLRDQTDRAVWHSIGTPMASSSSLRPLAQPQPQESASDSDAASSFQSGDLELQKDDRGKYYYTFTSESSSHLGSERASSPFAGDATPHPAYFSQPSQPRS